jgi:hypothetical protein
MSPKIIESEINSLRRLDCFRIGLSSQVEEELALHHRSGLALSESDVHLAQS